MPPLRAALSVATLTLGATLIATAQDARFAASTRVQWTRINPVTALTPASFRNPPATDLPWVRMNLPPTADPAQIRAEIREMHNSGIAGVEVGQGAFPNNEQLIALLTAANQYGLKVSLSHGPTKTPAGYSIDSENARKSLFLGKVTVNAGDTFDGPLPTATLTQGSRSGFGLARTRQATAPGQGPAPGPNPGPGPGAAAAAARATLVAVLAFRCAAPVPCDATARGPVKLQRSSFLDLTSSVTGRNSAGLLGGTTAGYLRWSAPPQSPSDPTSGTQWQLIAFWTRGVFPQPDPFTVPGYRELIQSIDTGLTPEVKQLLKANSGDFFYDSHSVDRGSPDELWSNTMEADFRQRRNYDLIPNLPALFREIFDFDDGSAPRVREDFYAVRGDLWLERQIVPLRQWVRSQFNNVLRVQVEGEANLTIPITDMILATAAVDRPEHENLFVGDEVDNYLPMASANHMTGNPWYSTECCAALNRAYAQTFQDTVIRMHRSFAGGITKLVYHTWPYRDSPTGKWPGYSHFGQAGFSNAWGPREPYWVDARQYNQYFARIQQALTQGDAKTDVAVYMQNYLYPPSQSIKTRHWSDLKLAEAGYTRDFLNPELLALPNAVVTGKRLAASGPAYQALIIDSEQRPATDPDKTAMPVAVARRILDYARAGLPIIIVGTPPQRVPGNTPGADQDLHAAITQLLASPSVSRVAHQADVPERLRALGIRPAAEPAKPSSLLSIRRRDNPAANNRKSSTDYYFLYNQGIVSPPDQPATLFEPATGEPLDLEVSLEGRGRPYLLDAWSGVISPIAEYTTSETPGRVTMRIRLARDAAALIAISEDAARFGVAGPAADAAATTAKATTASSVAIQNGRLILRAEKAGTYSTTLSNGRIIQTQIANVPAPIDLTRRSWRLDAEDWQPANPYATTTGPAAAETRKNPVHVDLSTGLAPWPAIPQLRMSSGLGTYTTTFELPANWSPSTHGARLNLGEVFDTFTLTVNGQAVPIDPLSTEADISRSLKAGGGPNTITVRIATTLNNRLADLDKDVAARGWTQPYGLIGPVVVTPYRWTTIR